ncbi:MAG: hypothetical protein ACFFBV_16830, partial [Promethearchaeota archaeon]
MYACSKPPGGQWRWGSSWPFGGIFPPDYDPQHITHPSSRSKGAHSCPSRSRPTWHRPDRSWDPTRRPSQNGELPRRNRRASAAYNAPALAGTHRTPPRCRYTCVRFGSAHPLSAS